MEKIASYVLQNRRYIISVAKRMTLDQLNRVPEGFNNSIIWNIGHMTAVLLEMYYLYTGNELRVEEKYHVNFRIGTHPFRVDADEVEKISYLHLQTIQQLGNDYQNGLFSDYELIAKQNPNAPSLEDISNHFLFHEGLHFNNIMSIRRGIFLYEKNNPGKLQV